MILHWRDINPAIWRWDSFSPGEPNLACPCCGEFYFDPQALDQLQAARDILSKPIHINSGHRCGIHNAQVGGAPMSQHKKIAFDVSTRGLDRFEVLAALNDAGFTTFGYYQTFIHTDTRPGRQWYGKRARELWI